MDGSKRKLKQVTLDGGEFRTERAARRHLHPLLQKVNDGSDYQQMQQLTFGDLLNRYEIEEMPARKSTRSSYSSLIRTHLRPQWGDNSARRNEGGTHP
jgi:hypothetical protein